MMFMTIIAACGMCVNAYQYRVTRFCSVKVYGGAEDLSYDKAKDLTLEPTGYDKAKDLTLEPNDVLHPLDQTYGNESNKSYCLYGSELYEYEKGSQTMHRIHFIDLDPEDDASDQANNPNKDLVCSQNNKYRIVYKEFGEEIPVNEDTTVRCFLVERNNTFMGVITIKELWFSDLENSKTVVPNLPCFRVRPGKEFKGYNLAHGEVTVAANKIFYYEEGRPALGRSDMHSQIVGPIMIEGEKAEFRNILLDSQKAKAEWRDALKHTLENVDENDKIHQSKNAGSARRLLQRLCSETAKRSNE